MSTHFAFGFNTFIYLFNLKIDGEKKKICNN